MFRFSLFLSLPVLVSFALQGCLMGGNEDEPAEGGDGIDTVYVHVADSNGIIDTVYVHVADSNALAGVWMLSRSEAEWIEGGVTEHDTVHMDTANPLLREFYVIRGETILWSRYNPESNNSDVQSFRRLDDTLWLLGERDTLTAVREGSSLRLGAESTFGDIDLIVNLFFTAYTGAFPPPAWAGGSDEVSNGTPGEAIAVTVDSSAQVHFLSPGAEAWYRFEAVAGRSYLIRTFGNTDTYLELFDSTAVNLLEENDDYDVQDAAWNAGIEWTATASGTYYFVVTGYDSVESGTYTLSVSDVTSAGLGKSFPVQPEYPRKVPSHLLKMLEKGAYLAPPR